MNSQIKSLLKSLEKTSKTYWNISPAVGKFLNTLIRDRKYKKILEIGTSNGYSGIWLAEALIHTKGHLYTIESHYKKRFHLATENFKKAKLTQHITQILGHAPEAIPKTPPYFDMAFFDATKCEHLDYFNAIQSRIKKHGIIITDNINSHKKELTPYLKTLEKTKKWTSFSLNIDKGLLISIKS